MLSQATLATDKYVRHLKLAKQSSTTLPIQLSSLAARARVGKFRGGTSSEKKFFLLFLFFKKTAIQSHFNFKSSK